MSKILKIAAIVLCVFGFIGSIATAKVLGEFSFTLFLSNFISVALSGAVLFAVGQLLDNQETILANQERFLKKQAVPKDKPDTEPQNENKSVLVSNASKTHPTAKPGYWICKSCHAENPVSRKTCLECGAPK